MAASIRTARMTVRSVLSTLSFKASVCLTVLAGSGTFAQGETFIVEQDQGVTVEVPSVLDRDAMLQPGIPVDDPHSEITAAGPPCSDVQCNGQCRHCQAKGRGHRPWFNEACNEPGLIQKLVARHEASDMCLVGRADALILWRNAPGSRPLYTFNPASEGVALDADDLESPAAAGGRLSLFRRNACGESVEMSYLYGGQFFSSQGLDLNPQGYLTAPPGLDGIDSSEPPLRFLDEASGRLTGSIQSAELNRRWMLGPSSQFLVGFRWLQWYETLALADSYGIDTINAGRDLYDTSAINNLWGGQIGIDSTVLQLRHGFRVEGLVKAGAYANNAGQTSRYANVFQGGSYSNSVSVDESPASASFVGEVGLTGVLPLGPNWDFRFGYLGLWVTGLAQPAGQLSGQSLALGEPTEGSLNTDGTVIIQGLTLGLEGRW
jgi:hypothetical protein